MHSSITENVSVRLSPSLETGRKLSKILALSSQWSFQYDFKLSEMEKARTWVRCAQINRLLSLSSKHPSSMKHALYLHNDLLVRIISSTRRTGAGVLCQFAQL